MKIPVITHFGDHETNGCWVINYTSHEKWEGKTEVKAEIMLDFQTLCNYLQAKDVLEHEYVRYVLFMAQCQANGFSESEIRYLLQHDYSAPHMPYASSWKVERTFKIISAVCEFCDSKKYSITKSSYSFGDALFGGNSGSYNSAKRKIKETLVLESSENINHQLMAFLKRKGII